MSTPAWPLAEVALAGISVGAPAPEAAAGVVDGDGVALATTSVETWSALGELLAAGEALAGGVALADGEAVELRAGVALAAVVAPATGVLAAVGLCDAFGVVPALGVRLAAGAGVAPEAGDSELTRALTVPLPARGCEAK